MRIAVVAPRMSSGETGGAERLYGGLVGALREAGHAADAHEVPIDESSFDGVLEGYLACYDLDLRDCDLVISTKAPSYMVRHPRHVSYLLHTIRVFYDRFESEYGRGTREQHAQRRRIHALDRHGLHPERILAHFTNGRTVYDRLREAADFWKGVPFRALYHPPTIGDFAPPRRGEYVLAAGRLHPWKRFDLLIAAFRMLRREVPLKIAGDGPDAARLRALAAGDPRVEFLGRVSDRELVELYSGALVVPFLPVNEDYGLVTIEAFRARKPVLTCTDSGEPAAIVRNGETGFVVPPEPAAIAARLDELIRQPERAAEMGERGHASVAHITWESVTSSLLSGVAEAPARSRPAARTARTPLKLLVTDNQPIDPPTGGGRLRLLGLYGTLREEIEATYVGSFDWRGPSRRDLRLTDVLREIDVPLSDEHFSLAESLGRLLPGKTIIDVTMPWLAWSSRELVSTVQGEAAAADVVVFSHPWMYECAAETLRGRGKRVVYDAHNCEATLRAALLGTSGFGGALAAGARSLEGRLCRECDLVLACSEEDRDAFVELYGIPRDKIAVFPNGVDVRAIRPAAAPEREWARRELAVDSLVAVFIGSAYAPNAEAVRAIVGSFAPRCPAVTFLVAGGAAELERRTTVPANVRLLGVVTEEERRQVYAAADLALCPMLTGSGINIKLLDFMAAGLPVITTAVGARGVAAELDGEPCFVIDDLERFPSWIERLGRSPAVRARLGAAARALAVRQHDWQRISRRLGDVLLDLADPRSERSSRPFFSVVVATYERPESLRRLLGCLARQTFGSFEVVIVDQSAEPFDLGGIAFDVPVRYRRHPEPGAVRARNLGVREARGRVIAFTDDDCEPAPDWLARAHGWFRDARVAGLEGRIDSDQTDEVRYRVVTNVGFEGFGFMTANLFLRRDVFEDLGGFDERFDAPHFREDTDLAWRALSHGTIPFARDVRVLHPAHPRVSVRESSAERSSFFVHDALLFHKHPDRYLDLLRREGHGKRGEFWAEFAKGILRHRTAGPIEKLAAFTTPDALRALADARGQLENQGEAPVTGARPGESDDPRP